MGAHTTPEERYELVTRYQRSGLTQREFCEAEGLAIGTLRGWLHKKNWRLVEAPRFVEVNPSKRPEQVDAIELRLGDVRVVLPASITDDRIADLVVALERRVESTR